MVSYARRFAENRTDIKVSINIDGTGQYDIDTGSDFLIICLNSWHVIP